VTQVPATQLPLSHTAPLAPQSAFCVQLEQTWFWQIWPAAQSTAAVTQFPLTHAPAAHTWPRAHCVVLEQATQNLLLHTLPPLQSLLVRQSPATQEPVSHTWLARHCGDEVQLPQRLPTHACALGQSLSVRQLATVQVPPRQSRPALHWLSAVHELQVKVAGSQVCVAAQSALEVQLPGLQSLPAQTLPVAHWPDEVQPWHWCERQSWPAVGQSVSWTQSPATHAPVSQTTLLAWQSAVAPHWPQKLFWQISPGAQSVAAVTQSPGTQTLFAHTLPPPHSELEVQGEQAWFRHTFPPLQLADVTQSPA
jgi:hypothetical protein